MTHDIRLEWEDPLIWRWDRRRAVTVQAVPVGLATELRTPELVEKISKIKLPPGYTMEWDGEYKSARDAQALSLPGIVPAVLIMALILVGLFNSYRKPLIIVLIIPFAMDRRDPGPLDHAPAVRLRRASRCHESGRNDGQERDRFS